MVCEFLHPHVHILRNKSIQKAVDNEDSKESRSRVASGFYSEKAKKKADIRTNIYVYVIVNFSSQVIFIFLLFKLH